MTRHKWENAPMSRHVKWITIPSVILIAILLSILLFPFSARVSYEGKAIEYSLTDAGIAIAHEVLIDGVYYSRILGKDQFRGSFYISDVKGMTREKDNAQFSFDSRCVYLPVFLDAYGQPFSTEVSALLFDRNFQRLAVQFAYEYRIEDGDISSAAGGKESTFLVVGAESKEYAVFQYTQLLEEKNF